MLDAVLKRMRRKIEIIRLDLKSQQDAVYHDMNELLNLLDMLERGLEGLDDRNSK
jgi:hypothetical protein